MPTTKGWCHIEAPTLNTPTIAHGPDLADVKGQAGPRCALEIAAAGGHPLLLVGPPGTGESILASLFAALLPEMTWTMHWRAPPSPAWRGGWN